jgi:hypothetical protein
MCFQKAVEDAQEVLVHLRCVKILPYKQTFTKLVQPIKKETFYSTNRDPDNPGGLIVMGEALYGLGKMLWIQHI